MKEIRKLLPWGAGALLASLVSPSGAADGGAPRPFTAEPFPAEKTGAPTPDAWKTAAPVKLTSGLPPECRVFRVREWIKIRCSELLTAQLALLGGDPEGVALYIEPGSEQENPWTRGGEIVFPVRRGDRRMFEWATFGDSYSGNASAPAGGFLISESWAPGEERPTIVAQRTSPLVGEF